MTPNEARSMEGMVKLEGLDSPRMPLNYAIIGEDGKPVTIENTK